MDFNQIIVSHTQWKNKFRNHLLGKETLVASVVAQDSQCEFGKWLNGEGKKYSGRQEFDQAKKKHAHFHEVAADVVRQAKTLPTEEGQKLVGMSTDYGRASSECIAALVTLREAVQNWK